MPPYKEVKNFDGDGTKSSLESYESESSVDEVYIMRNMLFLTAIGILTKHLFSMVVGIKNRLF
ncbi:hypothetical protein [Cohaesibacter haloalkalitolerans]|uniref:hypothetical protein n=1 Tax=Cohaesibacter haloalkalitolerans TaxID=1162980 RepID=UPI000E652530|nr:hypothetical protein [Cohaesibacter haloalkalitolerans]